MELSDYKSLIDAVRCGSAPSLGFTDEEFDRVKACIDQVKPIETIDVSSDLSIDTSQMDCLPSAILELQKMLEDQQGKLLDGMKQGILRAKVQELRDNLDTVKIYYEARHRFLGEVIDTLVKEGIAKANQKIQSIEALPTSDAETANLIQSTTTQITGQLIAYFSNQATQFVPSRAATFALRLIGLNGVTVKLPDPETNQLVETTVQIFDSPFLTKDLFGVKRIFSLVNQDAYDPNKSSNPPKEISDYDSLPGFLYNRNSPDIYPGLYRKMAKPLSYLFTLEERGLTVDESLIDPQLKEIKDAPTTVSEGETTYYIQNQATYEAFYDSLKDEYPKRVKKEKEEVYPNIIQSSSQAIQSLAIREAADVFRKSPNMGSTVILTFYANARSEVEQLISDCDDQLKKLDTLIKENVMDEEATKKKILGIPCFTKAGTIVPESDPGCEEDTKKKLGTDPLYLRTLGEINFGLPDIGSQCYWKEFAKALNKICLLPFPDLSGPPPANLGFRYWPVNCVIPAGPALVLLTIPPIWKPLFVIPTAVGTLICFLTMPIAPIGIPLPSIYLFYFAPDGTKYLPLAVNIPLLWSNTKNLVFGYELDTSSNSQNPLGLNPSNSYKGYPIKGAFTQPLAISAASSKATRLAKLAIDIASGKQPTVTNINGEQLPFDMSSEDYSKYYLSETEMMKNIVDADPSKEFDRQLDRLKATLNKQLDKLGNMQTESVNNLREEQRNARSEALTEAETEKNLAKKRKDKKAARALNTITIQQKINSTVDDFNKHIDNIKFGTIRFPKDSTKNNPGIPEAITAVIDLITMASLGDFKVEESAKSLNAQMKKAVAKINMNEAVTKQSFNLELQEDLDELKDSLNNMVQETIKYLKGDPVNFDLSQAKDDDEAKEMMIANRNLQELARDALAFTAVALLNPPKITLFNFSKKCCEISSQPVFSGVPPEVAMAFAVLSALMQAIIDGLTVDSIIGFLGISGKQVASSFLTTLFDSLISVIPNVSLPDPANLLLLIQAFLVPILSLISIPKAFNPLQPPSISITIPLDPILKPLLKALIAALITATFSLIDEAADAYRKAKEEAGGSTDSMVPLADPPTVPVKDQRGVFGVSEADKESAKQVFSASCGFGTTVSVTVDETNTPVGQRYVFTDPTTGERSSTDSPVFKVSLSLSDGTIVNLAAFPLLALDLYGYFHLITGADIIEFIRTLMNSVFDMIVAPLKAVVDLLSKLSLSLNSYSFNIIEAALPLITILKLAKIAIDAAIPNSVKLKIISPDAFNLIQLTIIPALEAIEPVLKQIAWIGVLALCALGNPITNYITVAGARLIHPIMNMDDLPPWERLTHKNPLFAIFLDEIAWRGSIYATGSLIFQTKTPAVLPYSPTFPINHITPHMM